MAMIKKILAPTDFSDLSASGVRYACQLAKEIGAELVVINIVALDESNVADKRELEQHKRQLDEFFTDKVAGVGSGLSIRKVVEPGQPYSTIVYWAENERVDLIVTSSHGRSGLSRVLMGSVTEEIIRKSPCPVLVVPMAREN
ncbi:MAG TPA: universal stress protein [Candidatus Binatia bacterium]|jgi:nucleotide-binding universal stress UspA family protein